MPVKLRLARHGRKGRPFFHIIAADSRAPRDGKFIERVGSYNPNTNPATIVLNFDKALAWLNDGAQPTDTVRSILSDEGVMMKKHLLGGVKKGAFTAEQAEEKYTTWKTAKDAKVTATKEGISTAKDAAATKRFEAEVKINNNRVEAIAKKLADAAEAQKAEEAAANSSEEAADTKEA